MMTITKKYLIVVFSFLSTFPLFAQIGIMPEQSSTNKALYITAGVDNSMLTTGLGYAHGIHLEKYDRALLLSIDVSAPLLGKFSINDYRIRVGSRINLFEKDQWKVPIEINPIIRGTENGTYSATGFATEFSIQPGYYSEKRFIAAHISLDQQWSTYIKHSDFYRTHMYAEAQDGWLTTSASVVRVGIWAGLLINERLDLTMKLAYEKRGIYSRIGFPAFGTLSVGYRL